MYIIRIIHVQKGLKEETPFFSPPKLEPGILAGWNAATKLTP